jgi:hypothetical protein
VVVRIRVAVGYEYQVSGGPSFAEVLLPTLGDADGYSWISFALMIASAISSVVTRFVIA